MAEGEKTPQQSLVPGQTPGANIPALFSNRFYFVVSPATTRIVFSEGLAGETINTHTAIVMPTGDAEDLAEALLNAVRENREALERAKATIPHADKVGHGD